MHAQQLRLSPYVRVGAPRSVDDLALDDMLDLRTDVRLDELERRRGRALLRGEVQREPREGREPPAERRRRLRLLGGGGGGEAGGGPAAVGVARDDDVLDAELHDGVGEDGEDGVVVEVDLAAVSSACARAQRGEKGECVLGDVACDEDLAGLACQDDALGHTRVRAADPEDLCIQLRPDAHGACTKGNTP
jgi:hypothetical protein